jgi:alanine racemase
MSISLNYSPVVDQAVSTTLTGLPPSAYSALIVNLHATVENYTKLSSIAGKAECAAVLKADSYGLGAVPIALRLQENGCRTFFVAYIDEGIQLRQAFIQHNIEVDIFVLNGLLPGLESTFTDYNLIPTLTDLDQVNRWQEYAKTVGRKLPASLHIDTGMARTGLPGKEIQSLLESQLLSGIDIKLILSQMVYSHGEDPVYSAFQRQRFESALRQLPKAPASLAKSGAIFLGADYHYQMVRPGIGLHGINPTTDQENPLLPVVSLWAKVYQVQDVVCGQTIGYSQTFQIKSPMKIATITLGYADGYPWALANKGYVYFGDYQAPIVGRISMDLMTVDVTHVPEALVHNGAWAQIIGQEITIDKIAQAAGTVPYEVLLGLGKRFQRIYT